MKREEGDWMAQIKVQRKELKFSGQKEGGACFLNGKRKGQKEEDS